METFAAKAEKVACLMEAAGGIDRRFGIRRGEFESRRSAVWHAVREAAEVDVALAFSDEQYSGDVPYLGGNTNCSIEQVAFGLGPDANRSGIIAGFEGVYVAGQLAGRAGCEVYATQSLQLADEEYPVEGASLGEILESIAGKRVRRVGLLTPRQVIPAGLVDLLDSLVGADNVVDVQEPYQRRKNLKSDDEMRLLADASHVTAVALRAMLAVMEPGMDETEVAAFGDLVGKWMGCERKGFETMVGADSACVTMIGPALNRPVGNGGGGAEYVHLGTSYKRDGLTACCRRSVFVGDGAPGRLEAYMRGLVEGAFRRGVDAYVDVARESRPACEQEQALVDYYNDRTEEALGVVAAECGEDAARQLRERLFADMPGVVKGLARLKPYTGTHNAGYTECQEFYGAITLDSAQPLDRQIVTMIDVALRGRGSRWKGGEFEAWVPGFDYWVVEDTVGKYGAEVRNLTGEYCGGGREQKGHAFLPVNVQALVGQGVAG